MRILLVDDHTLFREALATLLERLDPNVAIIDAATAQEAIRLAIHYQALDLILLDIKLPDVSGISIIMNLQDLAPTAPIVVISADESVTTVKEALEAGAAGFLPKSSSSHETLAALRLVLMGEIYVSPKLLASLDESPLHAAVARSHCVAENQIELSPRQQEVLHLMAQGAPNKVIARQLDLAEGTVKLHVASILRALNVSNRTEAAREGARQGLIPAAQDGGQ